MPDPLLPRSPSELIVVGFAGRIGAGKTAAAKYLASAYGFQYARYSQILQEWRGTPPERAQLQKVGWETMEGGLQAELNDRLIGKIERGRSAAIDGLRHPVDFEKLFSAFGTSFRLIFLEAPLEDRYSRARSSFPTLSAFLTAESQPVERQIERLSSLANLTITNGGPLKALHKQIDSFIRSCGDFL